MGKKHILASSIEEFEELFRHHEIDSYNKYTIYKTNGPFKGRGKYPLRKPRVHWGTLAQVSPKLATTPYLIVATRYYVCHLGKCYYSAKLQRNLLERDKEKRHYRKLTNSKKVGCPANFKVQRLIVFSENMLQQDTPSERARMGDYIRRNISSVRVEHKYLFKFPDDADHQNHVKQNGKEPIDKRVIDKIRELVSSGRTCLLTVRELLEEYVETQIKVNDKNRRRFFPSRVDIQRTIHKAKLNLRREKNDQEKLAAMKNSLGSSSEVYFRPSKQEVQSSLGFQWGEEANIAQRSNGLLIVVQTCEMRKIYSTYAHEGIILDPTYKFCQFPFPLYSVAVETNVCYQIVAMFITESETREAIIDALNVLTHWNSRVLPKYALTDNNPEEFKAVEHVFPEIKVFIASFYCELAWGQRMMRKDLKDINHAEFLGKLRAIENAISEEVAQKAVNEFKTEADPILKKFFEKSWLKEIKRWAIIYRPPDMLLEVNEAIDRLDEEFKYIALSQLKDFTLSQMSYHLCKHFLPETLQQYRVLNANSSIRPASTEPYVQPYLMGLPQWAFEMVSKRIALADQDLSHSYVEYSSENSYFLISKKSNAKYTLKFDVERKLVTCTCFHFLKRRMICKHAIIVGRFYPMWNIEKLSSWLFDYSIFKIDHSKANSVPSTFILCQNEYEQIKEGGTPGSSNGEKLKDGSLPLEILTESYAMNLKEKCRQSIKSLESLMVSLDSSQLGSFYESLQDLHSKWSASIERNKIATESKDSDIPAQFLKKVIEFYARSKSKRKLQKRTHRRKKEVLKPSQVEDVKTSYIPPKSIADKDGTISPPFSVRIEESPSDLCEEAGDINFVDEPFGEAKIIHINNLDEI